MSHTISLTAAYESKSIIIPMTAYIKVQRAFENSSSFPLDIKSLTPTYIIIAINIRAISQKMESRTNQSKASKAPSHSAPVRVEKLPSVSRGIISSLLTSAKTLFEDSKRKKTIIVRSDFFMHLIIY